MNKILTRTILGISITTSVVLIVIFISYNMEIRKEKKEDTYTENNDNTETEDDTDISQKGSVDNTDEDMLTVSNKVNHDNEVNPFPNDKFDHSGLSSQRFNLYLSLMEDDSSEITDERLEWLDIGLEFVEKENREGFKERIDKLRAQ